MPLSLQTFPSLAEVNAAMRQPGRRYLGGGTLVMREVNEGVTSFDTLVRTTEPALKAISLADGIATLGAAVTMTEVAHHKGLAPIGKAARAVGGPAIRNMATVGGNLFAVSPYGDFAAALLALDAIIHFADRAVQIEEFLRGRENFGGVVSSVSFKLPAESDFHLVKVSRTKPKGTSVVSIAARLTLDGGGAVASARIALGCMADRPMRAIAAERALVGAKLTETGIAASVAAITQGTAPITDPVASAWYRSAVLPVHFRRLLLGT